MEQEIIYLSKNFALHELCYTNTGFPNNPGPIEIERLTVLAQTLLQPTRDQFGPIRVNDGFRSDEVNKAVGGRPESQHRLGEAADFFPLFAPITDVYVWIVKNLQFGQVILETEGTSVWIHLSLPRTNKVNQQALIFKNNVYSLYKAV